MKLYKRLCTLTFLLLEGILYYVILTSGGDLLRYSCFTSIVLCFVYALALGGIPLFLLGFIGTVGADYFLVICDPIRQLPGMVCFLTVQTLYAVFLHRQGFHRIWLAVRLGIMALITAIAFIVLKENADALAIISVLYYANLIMNMVMAFGKFKKFPMLAVGFVLFILCDTVIGLQVASGGYLPIEEGSLLHSILFMDLNLAWLFYLPSQVLIALTCANKD